MNTITPANLMARIYNDLSPWVTDNKGVCSLTQNPYDLLEMLSERPAGWRLTMHWEGDSPADESVRGSGVVRNAIRFIVDGDLGPTVTPKIALIKSTAVRAPFLDLVDAVRQRVMGFTFDWLRPPLNRPWYKGTDDKIPLPDGMYIAAYNVQVEIYSILALPDTN